MFIKRAKLFIVQANVKLENMNIQGFSNFGKRVEAITPINLNPEKYLYILNRAVSAYESYGPNQNHDAFEREELKRAYATFINAPVNFDHINNSIEDSTGIVIDAIWEEPVYKDGKLVDGDYVKNILAIDKEEAERKRPGCIQAILDGKMTDTSMGALCKESVCSECGHVAYDETQYCNCLKFHRGDVVHAKKIHANGITYGPHEYNRGITFFEDTIVTRDVGADKDAKFIAKIASTSKSVLIPYIISRVKEASMAEQNVGKSENVAQKDVAECAYGGDNSVKDKAAAAQAKGKSEAQKDLKGNGLMEMEDKGDYVLATFKMSKEAYKKIADGNLIKMGEEPEEVSNAKENMEEMHKEHVKPKMTDDSKDKAEKEEQEGEDEEEMIALSTLLRKGRITQSMFIEKMKEINACKGKKMEKMHEAKEDKEEEKEHEIVAKIKEASLLSAVWDKVKKVVKEAATPQLQGEDKGDYGTDPKAVDKKIIDARANVGSTQTAKENARPFATPEEREAKVSLLKAEAIVETKKGLMRLANKESADKAVTYIADEMSKKRPYNEVVKEAYDKYGEKVEKTAAVEITDGNKTIKVTDDAVTTQPTTDSADVASSPSVAGDMGEKMAKRLAIIQKLEKGESVDIASALSTPETINSGNARTKVSPMTKAVTGDGGEFIKKAEIDVEKKLDEGNLDDKASPLTKLETEIGKMRMDAKNADDTKGNTTIEAMRREANMLKLELKKRDIVEVVNQMVVKGMIDDDTQAKAVATKLLNYGAEQFVAFKESVAMVPMQKRASIEVPASNDLFQGMRTEAKGNDLDTVKWS